MNGVVSISEDVALRRLAVYADVTGKNLRQALYEEWPYLMRKIIDFTPPFAVKKSRGPGAEFATSASDLSVGRRATERDIYKTMRPFWPDGPSAVRKAALAKGRASQIRGFSTGEGGPGETALERAVRTKDFSLFNLLASRVKSGPMRGAIAIPFSKETHRGQRNRRGRVMREKGNFVVLGSDAKLLQAYVKTELSYVGFAKSGWTKALFLVGGDAPAYVTKHGTGGGDVIDDHANEDSPSITAINWTPWASRAEGDRVSSDAYYSRIESITTKIKVALRLAAEAAEINAEPV